MNKALLFFLLGSVLVLALAREVVHSEMFARLVQERLVRPRLARSGMAVSFRSFRVSLLPLMTVVADVAARLPRKGAGGTFESVSFRLDLFDLLQSRVTVSEMRVAGGELSIPRAAGAEDAAGKGLAPVVDRVLGDAEDVLRNLPFAIRKVSVGDVAFRSGGAAVRIGDASLAYGQGAVDVEASLADLVLGGDGGLGRIAHARASARVAKDGAVVRRLLVRSDWGFAASRGRLDFGDGSYRGSLEGELRLPELGRLAAAAPGGPWTPDGGLAQVKGRVEWGGSPFFDGRVAVTGLSSRRVSLRRLEAAVRLEGGAVAATEIAAVLPGGGTASTEGPVVLDLRAGGVPKALDALPVRLDRARTRDVLSFLGARLAPLDALATGTTAVSWDGRRLLFDLSDGLSVPRARLVLADREILALEGLALSGTGFRHDLASGVFEADALLAGLGGRPARIRGSVGAGRVDMGFARAAIDLGRVGSVAGVRIQGRARDLSLRVQGPLPDARIDARGAGQGLEVLRHHLGNAEFDLSYRIATRLLEARSLRTLAPESRLAARGAFDFAGGRMDLDVDAERVNYPALSRMIGVHLPGFLLGVREWNFIASGSASVSAPLRAGGRAVSARARAQLRSMTYRGESVPSASFDLSIDESRVALSQVVLRKGGGEAAGGLVFDRRSRRLAYDLDVRGIPLSSLDRYKPLGMGLAGHVEGSVSGAGAAPDIAGTASLRVAGARVGDRPVPEPSLDLRWGSGLASASWDLFDGGIRGEAELDFRDGGELPSRLSLDAGMDDLAPLFAVLSRGADERLGGSLRGALRATFPLADPVRLDLDLRLPEAALALRESGDAVRAVPGSAIRISRGNILEWDVRSEEGITTFASAGRGDLGGRFLVTNDWSIDPNLLTALVPSLLDMKGMIAGEVDIAGSGRRKPAFTGRMSGRRLALSFAGLPGIFEDVDFDAHVSNGRVIFNVPQGSYGRGEFEARGEVALALPHPRTDMALAFNNVNHPLYHRSHVVASGDLALKGSAPPYELSGKVSVDKVLFQDDLTELTRTMGASQSWSRHLPRKRAAAGQWLGLDLHIHGNDSIEIKNNVVSAALSADVRIRGNLEDRALSGSIEARPAESKMYFKGHEFSLDSGRVDFRGPEQRPPLVQIEGNAEVDAHRVFLSVVGGSDDLEIGLRSEPGLSQKDILSLIAFGYTSDNTESLDDEQRQFLTTMSLGSFFIDQLNIRQGFSDRMGVRLSIAPELEENEDDVSVESGASEPGGVRTLKSMTRLKLSSNIGQRANISISSSLGAENEQAQELAVDYSISDNVSVQGVYERVTGETHVQQTNSLGGDIKLKWMFGD